MKRRFGKEVRIEGQLLGDVPRQEGSCANAVSRVKRILDAIDELMPKLRSGGGFLPTLAQELEATLKTRLETFAQLKLAFAPILRDIAHEAERQFPLVRNCWSVPKIFRSAKALLVELDRIPDSHDDENTVVNVTISYLLPKTAVDEVVKGIASLVERQEAEHATSALLKHNWKGVRGEFLQVADERASTVFPTGVKMGDRLVEALVATASLVNRDDLDISLNQVRNSGFHTFDRQGGGSRLPDSPSTCVDSAPGNGSSLSAKENYTSSQPDVDWTDPEIPLTRL